MMKITKFAPLLFFIIVIVISFRCEKITYTFDNTKPAISRAPGVVSVDDTSATIVFETNEACHIEVKYGISTDYDSVLVISENCEYHQFTIGALTPYMEYHYKIYVWDFANNGPVKSDDYTFHTLHNVISLVREGWNLYAADDFSGAQALMYESYRLNPNRAETVASIAWTQIRLDSLPEARINFARAYSLNPYLPITLTGLALVAQIDQKPDSAIFYCNQVISYDPFWVLEHNPVVSYKNVRLILAECFFQKGQMANAQKELDLVWEENSLDSNIPTTWIVNEISYTNYESALIAAINYAVDNL
jgi:tetratricopeptide (TPR) repeat protein